MKRFKCTPSSALIITRNNAITKYNKTDDRLFTFVAACIPSGFMAVTNLYTELSETAG